MCIFPRGMRIVYTTFIFLINSASVFSQKQFLSLSALNDSADHYLPRILQKRALVNSSSAAITETRHQFLPAVRFNDQVNIGSDNSVAGSYFPYGIVPSTSSGVRAANDYQAASGNIAMLYGEYDLIDFGYKKASVDYAKSGQALSESDLQREMYILHGRICRSYFNLMISEARMAVERETVKRYDTIFSVINALTTSGIKPGSDSSLAKAELSKSRITYNQLNEQSKNYREEISYLTGVSPDLILPDTVMMAIGKRKNIPNVNSDTSVNPLIDYYANLSKLYISNEHLLSRSYLPKIFLTAASWAGVRASSTMTNINPLRMALDINVTTIWRA